MELTLDTSLVTYGTALYTYMKRFYGTEYKLSEEQRTVITKKILDDINNDKDYIEIGSTVINYLEKSFPNRSKKISIIEEYQRLISMWDEDIYPYIFLCSLKLVDYKNDICKLIHDEVSEIESSEKPLTLKHDNITVESVYMERSITLKVISHYLEYKYRKDKVFKDISDILESNSIDVLGPYFSIISESLKQATTSKSGGKYEDLISKYLIEIGLDENTNNIIRFEHEEVGSLENDFKFTYKGRKFGISAKKTLRERYKQYVNLTEKETDLDIFMTITLGTDLTREKANTIRSYGVYIFVSPEIYSAHKYLQKMEGVYSIFDLNLELLEKLK